MRDIGMTLPGVKGLPPGAAREDTQETLSEQILEVDGCVRVGGEVLGVVKAEFHACVVAVQVSPQ